LYHLIWLSATVKTIRCDECCAAVLQKANVPEFEVEGHLDSTTCCVTEPFTGEVGTGLELVTTVGQLAGNYTVQ